MGNLLQGVLPGDSRSTHGVLPRRYEPLNTSASGLIPNVTTGWWFVLVTMTTVGCANSETLSPTSETLNPIFDTLNLDYETLNPEIPKIVKPQAQRLAHAPQGGNVRVWVRACVRVCLYAHLAGTATSRRSRRRAGASCSCAPPETCNTHYKPATRIFNMKPIPALLAKRCAPISRHATRILGVQRAL